MSEAKFDEIYKSLKIEFLESCADNLSDIDVLIDRMYRDVGDRREDFAEMQRILHGIKGSAGTFGFHSVTLIAHRLEDYTEAVPKLTKKNFHDIQKFVDRIRDILESRQKPAENELQKILDTLPSSVETPRRVRVLLVMPKGVQRKLVGSELTSCGFELAFADKAVDAFALAVSFKPNMIVSSVEFDLLSGVELAKALRAISATSETPFVLCTSHADVKAEKNLPHNIHIVRKEQGYAVTLAKTLMKVGVFGKVQAA